MAGGGFSRLVVSSAGWRPCRRGKENIVGRVGSCVVGSRFGYFRLDCRRIVSLPGSSSAWEKTDETTLTSRVSIKVV